MSQLTVQIPDPVLEAARRLAAREQITVEEYISRMLAAAVRDDAAWELRVGKGRQVSRERFLQILRKAPDVPPAPEDEIKP